MRIILDNGAYTLRNMGDVAMLQTTVKRLREIARSPELMILTTNSKLLERYCPGTVPLTVASRDCAYQSNIAHRSAWQEQWARMKSRWLQVPEGAREFRLALDRSDGVFLCGGGFLNDINPHQTRPVLRMLTDAALRGKRTAMFSQGLGPLYDPELIGLLRQACRAGTSVGLREGIYGPEILSRAGVNPQQHSITGDDAVEMAWQCKVPNGSKGVGFSLRQVGYAEIEASDLKTLAEVVPQVANYLGAEIVPLPISFNSHERDDDIISSVTGSPMSSAALDSPELLVRHCSRCRVVLTGTYHAAVFALAQGIPCVCFYVSEYYRNKMEGLSGQFPGGCKVINLRAADAKAMLINAIRNSWEASGEPVASNLRKQAENQVHAARRFYQVAMGLEPSFTKPQALA